FRTHCGQASQCGNARKNAHILNVHTCSLPTEESGFWPKPLTQPAAPWFFRSSPPAPPYPVSAGCTKSKVRRHVPPIGGGASVPPKAGMGGQSAAGWDGAAASEALEQALQVLKLDRRARRFSQAPAQLFQDFPRALHVDLVGNLDGAAGIGAI